MGKIFAVRSALIICAVLWGFLITSLCGQHRSLMLEFEENVLSVWPQPDLAAAEASEETWIRYFRLLTKLGPVPS